MVSSVQVENLITIKIRFTSVSCIWQDLSITDWSSRHASEIKFLISAARFNGQQVLLMADGQIVHDDTELHTLENSELYAELA